MTKFRVWHIPQVPGRPFHVTVGTVREGFALCETLAEYDAFQFNQRIKPNYCNANGVEYFDEEDGEWYTLDFDDIAEFEGTTGTAKVPTANQASDAEAQRGSSLNTGEAADSPDSPRAAASPDPCDNCHGEEIVHVNGVWETCCMCAEVIDL